MSAIVWNHRGHPVEDHGEKTAGEWHTVSLVTYQKEEGTGKFLSVASQDVAKFLYHREAVHYATALAKYSFDCDLVRIS